MKFHEFLSLGSENSNHFVQTYEIINDLGQGYFKCIQIRDGLVLNISQGKIIQAFTIEEDLAEDCFVFNFHNSGTSINTSFYNKTVNLRSGLGHFAYLSHEGRLEVPVNESSSFVSVLIAPELFYQILADNAAYLPKQLLNLIEQKITISTLLELQYFSGEIQKIINQLFNCAFQNSFQKLFYEAKVLELIALQLNHMTNVQNLAGTDPGLKRQDIDRLHDAKEYLLKNICNPPSLLGLAKIVGLNDYKLKLGFKKLFGNTVFGFLRQYRMEIAKQLLQDGMKNVTEVSMEVGYSNPSQFAAAFKKQFGVNPGFYLFQK